MISYDLMKPSRCNLDETRDARDVSSDHGFHGPHLAEIAQPRSRTSTDMVQLLAVSTVGKAQSFLFSMLGQGIVSSSYSPNSWRDLSCMQVRSIEYLEFHTEAEASFHLSVQVTEFPGSIR